MMTKRINGKDYRLPEKLSSFQEGLYVHLINWKWEHITKDPGYHRYRKHYIPYDAILPKNLAKELRIIYPPVRAALRQHSDKNHFRFHRHFNHMASSQAANVNLFLPVLHHPKAAQILSQIKKDLASLATDQLDHGYCLEFWGGNFRADMPARGPLNDKTKRRGTDSDIAIAYRNRDNELCLWLIEHKLTEKEFTCCSGPKSKDRDTARHLCSSSFAEIIQNKQTCFHHDVHQRKYWEMTERHRDFFLNHASYVGCPFQGGLNQLWRNQLLALALEKDEGQPYARASFSVVKHPANPHLDDSLGEYRNLIANNPKFFIFTSEDVVLAAEAVHDNALDQWAGWYRNLYKFTGLNEHRG